ncbi:MAG TPA: hypothetical protein VFT22_36115 [Kofleriaceae bacterium]|nr:hypothetical protein [Kofleriaceae bacterium]
MNEQPIAQVHVWSNGGYISIGGEPMTHIGFEIHNASLRPIVFDEDALVLIAFDNAGAELPGVRLMSIEPIGPTLRPVRPGATLILGGYFMIPVRPRAVDAMQVQWALRAGDQRYLQVTRFTRDDDYPVLDAPRTAELRHPRA